MAVFFIPRDSRSVGKTATLPEKAILAEWKPVVKPRDLNIFSKKRNIGLPPGHTFYYEPSLFAISQMGTGPGKGLSTTVATRTRACVCRIITGGERWSG